MRRSCLLMILALLGSLTAAQLATAASSSPSRPAPTASTSPLRLGRDDESEVEEEVEVEVEECEAAEGSEEEPEYEKSDAKEEECGEEVETGGKGSVTAPPACLVHRAESRIATLPASDRVRLSVRYQTYEPTKVVVGLKLKDHKGSLTIAHATKHLSDKGLLQITAKVDKATMERVLEASEFDVSLRAPGTPAFCAGDLEQRLPTGKHGGGKA